jgi:hypothetical protein
VQMVTPPNVNITCECPPSGNIDAKEVSNLFA